MALIWSLSDDFKNSASSMVKLECPMLFMRQLCSRWIPAHVRQIKLPTDRLTALGAMVPQSQHFLLAGIRDSLRTTSSGDSACLRRGPPYAVFIDDFPLPGGCNIFQKPERKSIKSKHTSTTGRGRNVVVYAYRTDDVCMIVEPKNDRNKLTTLQSMSRKQLYLLSFTEFSYKITTVALDDNENDHRGTFETRRFLRVKADGQNVILPVFDSR
jgi:hypothetical protein